MKPMFPVSVVPRAKMRATFLQGPEAWDSDWGYGDGRGEERVVVRKRRTGVRKEMCIVDGEVNECVYEWGNE